MSRPIKSAVASDKAVAVQIAERTAGPLEQGYIYFLFNLAGVACARDRCPGELLSVFTNVQNKDSKLKFAGETSRTKKLSAVVKLNTGFEVFNTEAVAIESARETDTDPSS